ncbi:hypothetical protein AGABI1DRAFT_95114 [Agaricus bisporus var. burnettii JB137-S8]|uniref:Uncharacterized protein n=1 Tax=Agaricus bisporus var. burnettii (strain JB137-S8 / ATCC MYA-4627 / FGSC 10392) TaxID=597362 RepID=K5WIT4_AGABU|nr:uncharacterized protein AGABI1DRAFT_95114 [Agaricus bisporus var. burnettii JB137-S8]EKM75176.1 hypothetical protein AGABI1DRAFT_95114 [Agaricus bisporus var. burnettii JB137-S8]
MATDTPPTSNKAATGSMKWNSLSQEDQEALIKILEDPSTLQQFGDACKHIGQTAVAVDEDFRTVKNGFAAFIENYGNDFPDVANVFVPRWDGYMARWNGDAGLLWSSRTLATDVASTLSGELFFFESNHPIGVSKHVVDEFKNLRNDIEDFSKDFKTYMNDQQQTLSGDANMFEGQIIDYESQIASLNAKIIIAAIDYGLAAPFGFLGLIFAHFSLEKYIKQRNHVQAELNTAIAGLVTVITDQVALAAMQAEFETLKPAIKEICHNLGIFATIWAYTHEQFKEINTLLDEGLATTYKVEFKTLIKLLKAQVKPLQEGMRQYAMQITPL